MWSSFKAWLLGILPADTTLQFICLSVLAWFTLNLVYRLLGVRDQPFLRVLTLALSLAGAYVFQTT